jgi:exoribonuclease-2
LKRTVGDASVSGYGVDELHELAQHCTEMETVAEKVERRMRKSAAAMFLCKRIGEHFDAIVTGCSDKGTWVRIPDPPVEGKLVKGSRGCAVGNRLRVKLLRAAVDLGYLDFARV